MTSYREILTGENTMSLVLLLSLFLFCITSESKAECGGTVTASSRIISSPNYPDNYPSQSDCTWSFQLQAPYVRIEFLYFELESQSSCKYDAVNISYGSLVYKTLCGTSLPQIYRLPSASLKIHFRSDGSLQRKGFQLVYRSLGEHHLSTADGVEQEVSIERLFKHHRYNRNCQHNYDVALLKLNRKLRYNNRLRPVCLPESDFPPGTNCYITGWGSTENITTSQVLKEAKLPLVSRDTCQKSYNDFRSFGYCVTKRMPCAGYARGSVDACRGDSGGPLVCHRNRTWYLMGVVSWGDGCGLTGRYGVYADVLKLKQWIQETIQDF